MKWPITVLAAAGLLLAACEKKSEAAQDTRALPPRESVAPKPTFAVSDSFRIGLGKVYAGYLDIAGALAQDDFPKAMEAYQAMHGALHMLPKGGMDTTASVYWDTLDVKIMRVLHPMAASENIEAMRDHFIDFTPLVLEGIEKFGVLNANPAFLYHCPMARKGQGADWLQKDSVLRNPYFGKHMSGCGTLVKKVDI